METTITTKTSRTIKLLHALEYIYNQSSKEVEGFTEEFFEKPLQEFFNCITNDISDEISIADDGTIGLKEMQYILRDDEGTEFQLDDMIHLCNLYNTNYGMSRKYEITDTDIRVDIVDFLALMNNIMHSLVR